MDVMLGHRILQDHIIHLLDIVLQMFVIIFPNLLVFQLVAPEKSTPDQEIWWNHSADQTPWKGRVLHPTGGVGTK